MARVASVGVGEIGGVVVAQRVGRRASRDRYIFRTGPQSVKATNVIDPALAEAADCAARGLRPLQGMLSEGLFHYSHS